MNTLRQKLSPEELFSRENVLPNAYFEVNKYPLLDLSNPLGLLIYYTETTAAMIRRQKR